MPSGIEILKLLPKTNCGECGQPTCLAFAMNIAAGKMELSACPYVSEEARAALAESAAPPIREVTIGTGPDKVTVGGETVLFRHEKTFFHRPGLALLDHRRHDRCRGGRADCGLCRPPVRPGGYGAFGGAHRGPIDDGAKGAVRPRWSKRRPRRRPASSS